MNGRLLCRPAEVSESEVLRRQPRCLSKVHFNSVSDLFMEWGMADLFADVF